MFFPNMVKAWRKVTFSLFEQRKHFLKKKRNEKRRKLGSFGITRNACGTLVKFGTRSQNMEWQT